MPNISMEKLHGRTGVVRLESRIPEIIGAMPERIKAAQWPAIQAIADDVREHTPVWSGPDPEGVAGELQRSVVARSEGTHSGAHTGVWLLWWYKFPEFGSVFQDAEPWVVPAAERHRDSVVAAGRAALEKL